MGPKYFLLRASRLPSSMLHDSRNFARFSLMWGPASTTALLISATALSLRPRAKRWAGMLGAGGGEGEVGLGGGLRL